MESNHRLHAYKTCSLTTELLAHRNNYDYFLHGLARGSRTHHFQFHRLTCRCRYNMANTNNYGYFLFNFLSVWWDSNPRLPLSERGCLPLTYTLIYNGAGDGTRTHIFFFTGEAYLPLYYTSIYCVDMVSAAGIEPA